MTRRIVPCTLFVSLCLPGPIAGQPDGDPLPAVPPCDLVFHGPDFRYRNPDLPDAPLSHGGNLPVEFRLHAEFPRSYRPVIHAAAAELNRRSGSG